MGDKGQAEQESKLENEFVAQYVLKKGERISAALAVLGRLIGSDDPYGARFVQVSHSVLDGCVLFASALVSGEGLSQARRDAFQALQRARSLLTSAFHAGVITEHTFLTLSEEVGALNTRIGNITEHRLYALAEREAFVVASSLTPTTRSASAPQGGSRRSNPRQGKVQREGGRPASSPRNRSAGSASVRDEAQARREAILALIGHKGRVSIRDIAEEIRSVSAKTIQRELNALIREGLVVREGERRWSTYRLAG